MSPISHAIENPTHAGCGHQQRHVWVVGADVLKLAGDRVDLAVELIDQDDAGLDVFAPRRGDLVSRVLSSMLKCVMLWYGENWTAQAGVGVD
jgi:hypothetical protein